MTVTASDPVSFHGLRFEIAAVSEQGPRAENQDAFSIDTFADTGVIAVADGMGGERSGRLAADTALEAVIGGDPIRSLDDARRSVRRADATVAQAAQRKPEAHGGMGCALGFISLVTGTGDGTGWVGAHVGDVRILSRSPDGTLRLETRDHTPAFARWEAGEISLDEIPDTSGANRLQRAVGRGGEADVVWLPARPGWSWILISDGVYKVMRLDELAAVMAQPSVRDAVEGIRGKVLERGPDDNFTAVLVRILDDSSPTPLLSERTLPMTSPSSFDTAEQGLAGPAPSSRSGGSGFAALLAVLALLAAGAALWLAWQGRAVAERRTDEIARLHTQIDSLGALVQELRNPFGPAAGEPVTDSLSTPLNAPLP